jgi:hypothetical protein
LECEWKQGRQKGKKAERAAFLPSLIESGKFSRLKYFANKVLQHFETASQRRSLPLAAPIQANQQPPPAQVFTAPNSPDICMPVMGLNTPPLPQ